MLSRVQVKRIKLDIPACNFNRNELEIAGTLASGDRRLLPVRASALGKKAKGIPFGILDFHQEHQEHPKSKI